MKNTVEHISSLSPLRGIAALWVLFFHLDVILFYRDLGPLISHEVTGLLQKGYLWVDFFFILSGFIITHVYREKLRTSSWKSSVPNYLWCRFTRLYPLHIFTLLVAIVVATPVQHFFPQVVDCSWKTYFDWGAIPSHLFFTNAMKQHVYLSWNIASWSIGAEWWTYVCIIPVFLFLPARGKVLYALIFSISYFLLALLVTQLGNNKLDITFDYGFLRCLFEFFIGICVYQVYQSRLGARIFCLDSAVFGVCALLVVSFHWQWHDLISVPLFSLLILASAQNQGKFKLLLEYKFPQYLGKISYSIYLVHSLWFLVFWNVLPHLDLQLSGGSLPASFRLLYVCSFILLTIICSHYTYYYVEVGFRKKLRGVEFRKP